MYMYVRVKRWIARSSIHDGRKENEIVSNDETGE